MTRGVACIVLRAHESEPVLLLRRAFGEFEGKWCFVAGSLEPGEAPEQAAARELAEETGIGGVAVSPLVVTHYARGLELHVFVARVAGDASVRLDSEHSEWCWASFDRALELLPLAEQREVLERARP